MIALPPVFEPRGTPLSISERWQSLSHLIAPSMPKLTLDEPMHGAPGAPSHMK